MMETCGGKIVSIALRPLNLAILPAKLQNLPVLSTVVLKNKMAAWKSKGM